MAITKDAAAIIAAQLTLSWATRAGADTAGAGNPALMEEVARTYEHMFRRLHETNHEQLIIEAQQANMEKTGKPGSPGRG